MRPLITVTNICIFQDKLPAGAPTSPVLSNMICARLDRELTALAKEHRCWYTRYADDLTFSTNRRVFPAELCTLAGGDFSIELGPSLAAMLKNNGFAPNLAKLRLQASHSRQVVTGLTVNRFPNVSRATLHRVRAMLHSLEVDGPGEALRKYKKANTKKDRRPGRHPNFPEILRGHIEHIGHVRGQSDSWYIKLAKEFARLQPDAKFNSPWFQWEPRDVFLCHASEDKETLIAPLMACCEARGVSCWWDQGEINWGDGIVRCIDRGLSTCRIVVVIVTSHFARKEWPQREMQAATLREIDEGDIHVLPIFVGSESRVRSLRQQFPLLAIKNSITTSQSSFAEQIESTAAHISEILANLIERSGA